MINRIKNLINELVGEVTQPIVNSENFKKWFDDSKIVDEHGEPLVVYHGTNKNFVEFSHEEIGSGSGNRGHYGEGFYFSYDIREAKGYGKNLLEAYLKITNPFDAGNPKNFEKYAEDYGFKKEDLAINFGWLISSIRKTDKVAHELALLVDGYGFEKGWEVFIENHDGKVPESKLDLNEVSNWISEYCNSDSKWAVPDYIKEELKVLGETPVYEQGYEAGSEPNLLYMTDYGQSGSITKTLKEDGYDGVLAGSEVVAFYPNQIKSVDNKGTFNPNSNSVYESDDKTETDSFKTWFDGSRVVDEQGNPLVVYHGTSASFDTFSLKHLGISTKASSAKQGFFFASDEETARGYANFAGELAVQDLIDKAGRMERLKKWDMAVLYTKKAEDLEESGEHLKNSTVMKAYLKLENPIIIDADGESFVDFEDEIHKAIEDSKRRGRDGVIIKNLVDNADYSSSRVATHYLVFSPNQIKSVNNKGTFSLDSDNIYEQEEGM